MPGVGHHQEWSRSEPPGIIFKRLGGIQRALYLADEALIGLLLNSYIQLFRQELERGSREGRWVCANGMASFLKVNRQWLGRLIAGKRNVGSMKVRDLLRCCGTLGLLTRELGLLTREKPTPQRIEKHVLHVVVQAMREQRRNGSTNQWPDLGNDDEAETIRQWAERVGYIDDAPARDRDSWQGWLSRQKGKMQSPDPDSSSHMLKLIGLGDWLVAQPYLPLFETQLYFKLRAVHKIADDRNDSQLKKDLNNFEGPLAEAQEMLYLFRSTKNGTIEEVAKIRKWYPATVGVRLGRLELTAGDFLGENAVLGRLIVQSPVLRPRYDGLLSRPEWSDGSADTHLAK
jgi:hypothetical protein